MHYTLLETRLLLDSRVVDMPMACNPTFVMLSSLQPFFFNLLGQIPRSLLRLFPGCYCRVHERLST